MQSLSTTVVFSWVFMNIFPWPHDFFHRGQGKVFRKGHGTYFFWLLDRTLELRVWTESLVLVNRAQMLAWGDWFHLVIKGCCSILVLGKGRSFIVWRSSENVFSRLDFGWCWCEDVNRGLICNESALHSVVYSYTQYILLSLHWYTYYMYNQQ